MAGNEPAPKTVDGTAPVPWPRVVSFLRQLTHDLRNQLNAAELQGAFLDEIATDAEVKAEVKRLRETISTLGSTLQKLSASVGKIGINSMPYRASEFIEDLQQKVAKVFPEESKQIKWQMDLGSEMLEVDPQLLQQAFLELFTNAFQHGRAEGGIDAAVRREGETVAFTLREPKREFAQSGALANWGKEPLGDVGRGHYALGLWRARGIIDAHKGDLRAEFDSAASQLVTTVTLPLSRD